MLKPRSLISELKMLSCVPCSGKAAADPEQEMTRKKDRAINKQLKEWRKAEEKVVKLLLLGTAESGKSTVTKQMKIIHISDFSHTERLEKLKAIRKNLKDAILSILGAMNMLGIKLYDSDLQSCSDYILSEVESESDEFTQEFYDYTCRLWKDAGVQECYQRSNEYQLIDSAKYFLDRVHELRKDCYIPSDQDILRCRIMTNSIQRIDFSVKDGRTEVPFSVYDVGGQQGERRKWIQVFDSATAILFVLDCSSYDLTLREDTVKNRLLEAATIFEQVWNSRYLRYQSIILFINKIDLLEEKINSGKTFDKFANSIDKSDPYYDIFQAFHDFPKAKDSERREFMEAFPRPTDAVPETKRESKRRPSAIRTDINDEVIRTAVFIKRLFMSLVQQPILYNRGNSWHSDHTCEYFYTCAVDTHTIKKVLEGCRSLIIKRHLGSWGM